MAPKKKEDEPKTGFKYKVLSRAMVHKEIHEPGAIVVLPERDLTSENEKILQFLGEVKGKEEDPK